MKKRSIYLLFLTVLIAAVMFSGFKRIKGNNSSFNKVATNDVYAYIAINQILMYISNNGDGSHDPGTDANGFYWPGGKQAVLSAIFEDGLIWGGKIGRETRVNGNTHRQGLQAGKILESGLADNPGDPKYRIYKIQKGWENLSPGPEKDAFQKDYEEWPVEDGAPWVDTDGDGVYTQGVDEPQFIGDQVLWYVANDLDESRSTFTYGTGPIGLEFQTTVFGFNRTGDFGDIVFKKYLVINKGSNTFKDMVFGYWSDTDMGTADDDYTGCDTVLSLGYTWNGTNTDGVYGSPPPSVGYDFFQGPIIESPGDSAKFLGKWRQGYRNIPLTAFTLYINSSSTYSDPSQGVAEGSVHFYRYLTGQLWNGNPFTDPNTGQNVNFVVPGDPVAGIGWYEGDGWPGGPDADDRRHLMASGTQRNPATQEIDPATSFEMAPGDSQEIVVGIIIAKGQNNIDSITELKRKDLAAQIAFDLNFKLTQAPDAPQAYGVPSDREIMLYWEDNSENYEAFDQLLQNKGLEDTTYTFEGYRIWQFSDETGSDPTLVGIFDVDNEVTTIYETQVINGVNVQVPVINSENTGLRRQFRVVKDALTGDALRNGTPYYFAVTAYGYSPNSIPSYLENPPVIFQVRPGSQKIDITYTYDLDDHIIGDAVSGDTDGILYLKVFDPDVLTGETYRAVINGSEEDGTLSWTFTNKTTGDTILKNNQTFNLDTVSNKIVDGFIAVFQNQARDSLNAVPGAKVYGVKSVQEIANGSGELERPRNVMGQMNSTGDFKITTYGTEGDLKQNINPAVSDAIGLDAYEIRFTEEGQGSEYYLYGYSPSFRGPVTNDPKASNKVPFEIWNVGRDLNSTDDDVRLKIKIQDAVFNTPEDQTKYITDSLWTRSNSGRWEAIYAFIEEDSSYHDNLPATSGRGKSGDVKMHNIVIDGQLPEAGTVIRITPWRPVVEGNAWEVVATAANKSDFTSAKNKLDEISVFPNPYFGANPLERDKYQKFVRFTNLPSKVTVRIFSLAGVFVNKLEKDDQSQWLDWNLLNIDNLPVASGIYIAHLDMPSIGTKVMKIAIVQEKQIIDRL
ncbi:MAG: T9SS type A sorting domain-containing protein [Calditrichae bacterium]|nr:T9SS type A sorting domain-containing protein [Calditrichota bacterium]MCB9058923.1 T9SS type A sorting domain-containing protein [Calditrichia bacterium]